MDDLLTLHALTSPAPRLEHEHGMAVVVTGDHTTQFARGADAQFFVAAHREVPALVARVRELETQLGQGELDQARARVADLERALEHEQGRARELEQGITKLTAENERLLSLAREGARMRQVASELAKRALALESELEKLRAPGSK